MDPYCLYHTLGADYVPIEGDEEMQTRPPNPSRWRYFIYGCALYAHEEEVAKAGAQQQRRAAGG